MLQARMRFIAPQKYEFICTYTNIFHNIKICPDGFPPSRNFLVILYCKP